MKYQAKIKTKNKKVARLVLTKRNPLLTLLHEHKNHHYLYLLTSKY